MLDHGVTFSLGNWKVNGYSAASRVTWLIVPQLNSIFDIGWCVEPMRHIPRIFLSHLHQDHCIALPTWIAWRQKFRPQIPQIYVPQECVEQTQDFVKSICVAERFNMQYEIIGLKDGQQVEIENNRIVEAFTTTHCLPTIGFLVKEKRKKLSEDFEGKSSNEIRDAVKRGEIVHKYVEIPIFCYTSDTDTDLFKQRPDILNAEILITECSYLEEYLQYDPKFIPPENQVTHNTIAQLAPVLENFTGKTLAFCHLPRKYEMCDVRAFLLPRIPKKQRDKLQIVPHRSRKPRYIYTSSPTEKNASLTQFAIEFYDKEQTQELPEIVYHWQNKLITYSSALQLYEDAYYQFLKNNSHVCQWLVEKASDVYQNTCEDIHLGIDYPKQKINPQCIAIRRALQRLGLWFSGKRLLEINGMRSEGYVLDAHVVPFHEREHIVLNSKGKGISGSIEHFWCANRVENSK
ncbi:MBL fold metallo-hydrolase [Candidatus Uabimicrobium sp. HlEnr_7]|uniref:MBL fold metallo-hydrolase n=1 Tax=Candidatus Uabimicrobium helgolandensis TaxID=3095367 RepID=UPI003556AFD8